ncbi:MAG: hypothetical protein IKW09_01585 [Alphaproteobacteria bacterium]|nr:hypothetical protein [Alphaproteobacteria bacterium]
MPNLIVGLSLAFTALPAHAIIGDLTICSEVVCPSYSEISEAAPATTGCVTFKDRCYEKPDGSILLVQSCTECEYGMDLTYSEYSSLSCSLKFGYNVCESDCANCTNCISDTSWSSAGTGYQKKVTRTCDCGTCKQTTSYRCAANYYGSSSNGTSGCTACPSYNGIAGTSSAGSTSASSCCISSGATYSFSDTAGSGTAKISSKCCAS